MHFVFRISEVQVVSRACALSRSVMWKTPVFPATMFSARLTAHVRFELVVSAMITLLLHMCFCIHWKPVISFEVSNLLNNNIAFLHGVGYARNSEIVSPGALGERNSIKRVCSVNEFAIGTNLPGPVIRECVRPIPQHCHFHVLLSVVL